MRAINFFCAGEVPVFTTATKDIAAGYASKVAQASPTTPGGSSVADELAQLRSGSSGVSDLTAKLTASSIGALLGSKHTRASCALARHSTQLPL